MNLKKLLNKTEAQEVPPTLQPKTVSPLIPDLEGDEDEWGKACYPPSDRDECLEKQAGLFVMLTQLLIEQHELGCGLGPLIPDFDGWCCHPLACDEQPEDCRSECLEINNLLACLSVFIDIGCPEAPETEGCCCHLFFQNMSVKEQMQWLEMWNREGGISQEEWQWFYDSTYCIHSGEGYCNSEGGEFYPGTSEGECDSLECPPNCP